MFYPDTDLYKKLVESVLDATKHAWQKKNHPQAIESLKNAVDHAETYSKYLLATRGNEFADKFKKEFAPHVDRIASAIEKNGTKLDRSKLGKSIAQGQINSLLKSMSDFEKPLSPKTQLDLAVATLHEKLRKAKIYDFASRKQVADLGGGVTAPKGVHQAKQKADIACRSCGQPLLAHTPGDTYQYQKCPAPLKKSGEPSQKSEPLDKAKIINLKGEVIADLSHENRQHFHDVASHHAKQVVLHQQAMDYYRPLIQHGKDKTTQRNAQASHDQHSMAKEVHTDVGQRAVEKYREHGGQKIGSTEEHFKAMLPWHDSDVHIGRGMPREGYVPHSSERPGYQKLLAPKPKLAKSEFRCDGCHGGFPKDSEIRASEKGSTKGQKAARQMENHQLNGMKAGLGDILAAIPEPVAGDKLALCSDCAHEMNRSINIHNPEKLGPKPEWMVKKNKPGALDKSEVLSKPYSSDAQRKWAHTDAGTKALGGESKVKEWDEASKGKKLPEHVEKTATVGHDAGPNTVGLAASEDESLNDDAKAEHNEQKESAELKGEDGKALDKAKIIAGPGTKKPGKVLADLPSDITPKQGQPILRDGKKVIVDKQYVKAQWNPDIMPEKKNVPGGEGTGKDEVKKAEAPIAPTAPKAPEAPKAETGLQPKRPRGYTFRPSSTTPEPKDPFQPPKSQSYTARMSWLSRQTKGLKKSIADLQDKLEKAKIISFKDRKVLADLPTEQTPKETKAEGTTIVPTRSSATFPEGTTDPDMLAAYDAAADNGIEVRHADHPDHRHEVGIHLLKPSARELQDAVEDAAKDNFPAIVIHHSEHTFSPKRPA